MMTAISKATIIIPLVVLMVGTIFVFKNKIADQKTLITNQEQVTLPTSISTPKPTSQSEIKLDLKGPYVCDYSSPSATISAKIKDKNISVKKADGKTTSNYLLKGDCLYMWDNNISGKIMCGMSQYITMFDTLSGMGIMNIGNILKNLPQIGNAKNLSLQETDVNELFKTCRKEEIKNSVFEIPKQVTFNN